MNIISIEEDIYLNYPVGHYINQANNYINIVYNKLKDLVKDYPINIWCRGSSGAILSTLLANKFPDNNCLIFHVKKEGEQSHHGNYFVKAQRSAINIIIDDFIASGDTINEIFNHAKPHINSINFLIVSSISKNENWFVNFVPNNLITSKESIYLSWEQLIPTRIEKSYDPTTEQQLEELLNN